MTCQTSFLSLVELSELGLKAYGENVLISRKASLYLPQNIIIGDNVRIDDFCILFGYISFGSNFHISPYVALYDSKGIELDDYSGISANSVVYSAMDDFSGEYLAGFVHPEALTNVTGCKVYIKFFLDWS